uniref:Protein kinase domain-containing protein n=2 Tax=Tetradesmus obliquus TaxID=3088 RepID=A0A383WJU6_TETOB|eukprot:jgi/Sobl393_1/7309/SZX77523.1
MAFALQGRDQSLVALGCRKRYIRGPRRADALVGASGPAGSGRPHQSGTQQQRQQKQPLLAEQLWFDEERILVDESFEAAEGAQLSPHLKVAKHVGSGTSADVYKLQGDGKQPELVLKMAKPVPGLRRAFQREWMLGRRLNAVAAAASELNMIIHTGPAVVSEDKKGQLVFRGTVLEGINGKSLDSRLEKDASFCDVDFIMMMLQQVLTALHKAEALVGFQHGDLRISNIMEHSTDPEALQALRDDAQTWQAQGFVSAESAALAKGLLTFKILDFGHSKINERQARSYLKLSSPNMNTPADSAPAGSSSGSSSSSSSSSSLALQRLPAAKGPLEAFYSFWYRGRSDSWRLLRSLATRLDGRGWPKSRQGRVLGLYKLIEDVLDLKLQARFFQDTVTGADGAVRRVASSDRVYDEAGGGFVEVRDVAVLDVTAKPRRFKLLRGLREKVLRWWSRLFSRKPGVSAKEVLQRMQELGLTQ